MAEFWGFDQVDVKGLVFTSYNSLDWKRVSPIALELRKLGVPVWYDYGLNAGTDSWGAQISMHIDKASALVLFVTKGIFEREESYVIEEYKEAKRLGLVIVPVFLDDVTDNSYYRTIDTKYRRYVNFWEDLQGVAYSPGTSAAEIARKVKGILDRSPNISYPVVAWADSQAQMKKKAEETKAKADREAQTGKARQTAYDNANAGTRTKQSISVGSKVLFGRYPQSSNDPEPIIWRVLDIIDGKALMITEDLLDCKKYNQTQTDVTWETCTLRRWLNNDFLNKAFSAEEQRYIATVRNQNPDNAEHGTKGGNLTEDKVFCLSIEEAKKYFKDTVQVRKTGVLFKKSYNTYPDRMAKPTAYARKNGAYVDPDFGTGWWWLRSPGSSSGRVAYVFYNGNIDDRAHVNSIYHCVRPVVLASL